MLRVEHLSHIYHPDTPMACSALTDVSFSVNSGDFIGLIGHTGSGKSTLIQHLNGLLKPTSGTVAFKGKDLFSGGKKELVEIRRHVGLIFQYPEYQLFEETVDKDVAYGPKNMGLSQSEIEGRVTEALEMVGLNDTALRESSPFDLSGGQMRRVAIAGVLAMRPEILILDEPTAGLDPAGRDEIFKVIKKMHDENHLTVILVSHSMEDVAKLADRLIVMSQGKILMDDRPGNIFKERDLLETVGLDVPETVKLMQRLKIRYPNIHDGILTVEEAEAEILRVIGEDRGGMHVR